MFFGMFKGRNEYALPLIVFSFASFFMLSGLSSVNHVKSAHEKARMKFMMAQVVTPQAGVPQTVQPIIPIFSEAVMINSIPDDVVRAVAPLEAAAQAVPSLEAAPQAVPSLNVAPQAVPSLEAAPQAVPSLNVAPLEAAPQAVPSLNVVLSDAASLAIPYLKVVFSSVAGSVSVLRDFVLSDPIIATPPAPQAASSLNVGPQTVQPQISIFSKNVIITNISDDVARVVLPLDPAPQAVPPSDSAPEAVPPLNVVLLDTEGQAIPPSDSAPEAVPPSDSAPEAIPPSDSAPEAVPPSDAGSQRFVFSAPNTPGSQDFLFSDPVIVNMTDGSDDNSLKYRHPNFSTWVINLLE